MTRHARIQGFTLIELSIVLVIIGLIIGGILVGQDLIRAAETRAQLTQIEKYNSATNTFRSKFNAVPGDMRPELVAQYGFSVQGANCNGTIIGQRNGDGLIQGNGTSILVQAAGETSLYWTDLSSTASGGLIDVQIPNSGAQLPNCQSSGSAVLSGSSLTTYFPVAKIGHSNFVYVYSNGSANWFGVSAITSVNSSGGMFSNSTIPVIQAYNIDVKADDGMPGSGNIQATFINNNYNPPTATAPTTSTAGGAAASCYDTTTSTYSVTYNNGNGGNCALSFKMQ